MGDAVSNDLDREAFRIADRLVPSLAVTHHARKFESLRDPATILFAIQVNRQIHSFIIAAAPDRITREQRRSVLDGLAA